MGYRKTDIYVPFTQTEKKKNESISYPEVKQDISLNTWINLSQDLVIRENIPTVF